VSGQIKDRRAMRTVGRTARRTGVPGCGPSRRYSIAQEGEMLFQHNVKRKNARKRLTHGIAPWSDL